MHLPRHEHLPCNQADSHRHVAYHAMYRVVPLVFPQPPKYDGWNMPGWCFTDLEWLQAQSRKQAKEDREVANQRHVRQVGELEARLKEMQDTEALLQEEMERCQSQYRDQLQETQVNFIRLSETTRSLSTLDTSSCKPPHLQMSLDQLYVHLVDLSLRMESRHGIIMSSWR